MRTWMPRRVHWNRCWSWRQDESAGLGDAPWPPHFRKMEGEAPAGGPVAGQVAGQEGSAADEDASDRGSELSQQRSCAGGTGEVEDEYPEVAALLAVDDVLVDSMRGTSSTWTRFG